MDKQVEQIAGKLGQRSVDLVSFDELKAKLDRARKENRPLRIKYGADPSAPDIHLGHVVCFNKLREFQELGHTVIFLIGDFTGMIGDPSGRSQTRKPLSREQVQENAKTYQKQVFKILDPSQTEIRFNSEWCSPMKFEDVVRLTSHVTIAQMLARDDFAKRYAGRAPISLVEFLYPLIQAYDSVVLKADVEVGGTDQVFNFLLGRELQKAFGQEPQVVLTLPLIEGLDGVQKMSKSLGNYIGVTESAKDIFGKTMSVSDELMWKYFALVLCMPEDELKELQKAVKEGKRHPRDVKDDLARRVVARFHDATAAEEASTEFARVFSQKQVPEDVPTVTVAAGRMAVIPLLVKAKLASSNSEARRLIQQGAVEVGGERLNDPKAEIEPVDGTVIRCGKRGFVRLAVR
ncbi:MAG: tyrosine--tRNA ligase [Verrucomicrobiota bacterium]